MHNYMFFSGLVFRLAIIRVCIFASLWWWFMIKLKIQVTVNFLIKKASPWRWRGCSKKWDEGNFIFICMLLPLKKYLKLKDTSSPVEGIFLRVAISLDVNYRLCSLRKNLYRNKLLYSPTYSSLRMSKLLPCTLINTAKNIIKVVVISLIFRNMRYKSSFFTQIIILYLFLHFRQVV